MTYWSRYFAGKRTDNPERSKNAERIITLLLGLDNPKTKDHVLDKLYVLSVSSNKKRKGIWDSILRTNPRYTPPKEIGTGLGRELVEETRRQFLDYRNSTIEPQHRQFFPEEQYPRSLAYT